LARSALAATKFKVEINGYFSSMNGRNLLWLFGFGFYLNLLAAQEATFEPFNEGMYLINPSYRVDFDLDSRTAFWVHYELNARETAGVAKRTRDFRTDFRTKRSANAGSYRGSGYDRGHLKPAADSKSSQNEMSQSFLMTNMFPQTPALNRGVWRKLEEDVRGWALQYGVVHVTTGPSPETRAWLPDGIRVATACWKAVLRTSPDTSAIAFLMPNAEKLSGDLQVYAMSVDELERRLDIDLFPALPDATEARIEVLADLSQWKAASTKAWAPAENQPTSSQNSQNPSGISQQCTGISKSSGRRCRNSTKDPSGRCHHHRD